MMKKTNEHTELNTQNRQKSNANLKKKMFG